MTLMLELSPEIEATLTAKARQRGMALNAYLLELALRDGTDAPGVPDKAEIARRAAVEALAGKYAHFNVSSADIRADRDRDIQREDRFNSSFGNDEQRNDEHRVVA